MIEDKQRRKVNAIYEGNLAVSRDPHTGYQSMWSNFVQASTDTTSTLVGGPANVSVDERPVVEVLWPFVKPIINSCSQKMKPLLQRLGVQDSELSPFVREFDLSTYLADANEALFSCATNSEEGMDVEDDDMTSNDADSKRGRECMDDHLPSLINLAMDEEIDDEDKASAEPYDIVESTQVEIYSETDYDGADIGNGLMGWQQMCGASVDDLASVAQNAILQLTQKCSGSISNDTKCKSLCERWWTSRKLVTPSDLADSNGIMIERNVHIKLEISEEGGEKKAVEDSRVVAIYTKTYNK